jgi:hypothetical protein
MEDPAGTFDEQSDVDILIIGDEIRVDHELTTTAISTRRSTSRSFPVPAAGLFPPKMKGPALHASPESMVR